MRKIILILMLPMLMILCFSGCIGNDELYGSEEIDISEIYDVIDNYNESLSKILSDAVDDLNIVVYGINHTDADQVLDFYNIENKNWPLYYQNNKTCDNWRCYLRVWTTIAYIRLVIIWDGPIVSDLTGYDSVYLLSDAVSLNYDKYKDDLDLIFL